ncbi:MAG: hypothetical protein HZB38_08285, partial [Planctomycetes bacterium]|nr:hypothetical protein [Planctomycetota bacterium]
AVLAAVLVYDLGAKLSPQRARLRAILRSWFDRPLLSVALLLLTPLAVLAAVTPLLSPETRSAALTALRPTNPALLAPLAATFLSIGAMFACSRKRSSPAWIASLPMVLLLDLAVIGWTIDVPTDADPRSTSFQSNSRAELLAALNGSTQRMWIVTGRAPDGAPGEYHDPIGKIVANTNILDHVPLLTDYGPLTPRRYDLAFHFKPWGEAEAAAAMLANDDWMQWYDVGWLLLCEPALTPPEGARLAAETAAGYRLFRYPYSRGRAYFEKATQPGGVRYIEHSPHEFETRADTWGGDVPGGEASPRVVVARLAIPGWHATWGRRELPIEPAGGVLLSVRLPPGERPIVIRWRYSPPGLAVGAAVSGFGWSSLLVLAVSGQSPRAKRRVRSTRRR